MGTLDRYIYRSLLINYIAAFAVMISLYVVLDLFVNMDEFTVQGYPTRVVLANVISYYAPNVLLYFKQLAGVITLFACMATIARMRTLNELTAILSSGVSLFQVARPILFFAIASSALLVLDTEVLIPSVAHKLARDHDDVAGDRAQQVLFLPDRDSALLSAGRSDPATGTLHQLLVLERDAEDKVTGIIEADKARWVPPGDTHPSGRWKLDRGRRSRRITESDGGIGPQGGIEESFPQYYESDLTPQDIQLRQAEGWAGFLSLGQLNELSRRALLSATELLQVRHTRIMAPVVGLVMLLLGLPFFLDREPGNVLADGAKCVTLCGMCYLTDFVAQSLRASTTSPLPAWAAVFIFGPIATALICRIRT